MGGIKLCTIASPFPTDTVHFPDSVRQNTCGGVKWGDRLLELHTPESSGQRSTSEEDGDARALPIYQLRDNSWF